MVADCVFCRIVAGLAPATILREWGGAIAIAPLDPVTDGHTLVIPREHVADATERLYITALVVRHAAQWAARYESANILTSIGAAATQSIHHLHWHVVPRRPGDGLMLPWGTTGDPHAPHRCPGMDARDAELAELRSAVPRNG